MFFSSQRGVGEKAVGTSISLVAPAEEKEHQKICEAVRGIGSKSLEQVHIDGQLLNEDSDLGNQDSYRMPQKKQAWT